MFANIAKKKTLKQTNLSFIHIFCLFKTNFKSFVFAFEANTEQK